VGVSADGAGPEPSTGGPGRDLGADTAGDRAAGGRVHELKTWPVPFRAIKGGAKRFEYRKDDRGFAAGDLLRLREWTPGYNRYTGDEVLARVTYLLRKGFGLPDGYVVMSIEPAPPATTKQPEPAGPLTLEQRARELVDPWGDECDSGPTWKRDFAVEVVRLASDFAREALREAICMCANPECEARSRLTETEINAAIEAAAKGASK
jgi:hypothetical protein